MKKMLLILLIAVLTLPLSGCADMPGRTREFVYQYVEPIKTIERFFEVDLPKDTEIHEYEYLRQQDNTATIRTKISFSADGWNSFYESMTNAGYGSLDDETEEAKERLEDYEYTEECVNEALPWWDFNHEDAEGYYFYYAPGYVKHLVPVYVFAFNNGDFVTVYMVLGR